MEFAALYPEFLVADLEASEGFYTGLLRFNVAYRRDEERFVFLTAGGDGGAQVMLLEDNDNAHSRTGPLDYPRGQGVNFSIVTRDLDGIARRLADARYPLRIPVRDQWHRVDDVLRGERQLWVQDPDGYLLRFIEGLGQRGADTDAVPMP